MNLKHGSMLTFGAMIAITVSIGLFLSFTLSDEFRENIFQRTIDVNANFIQTQAKSQLVASDFATDNPNTEKTFSQFFKGVDTNEIQRIKVWNVDGTVIYSDDKDIVGKRFANSEGLEEALQGKIAAEIADEEDSEAADSENHGDSTVYDTVEVYVPILSGDGHVMGIIETYTSMQYASAATNATNEKIVEVLVVGAVLAFAGIFVVFRQMRKNAILPILAIQNSTKKITAGDLDVKLDVHAYDEIQNLARDVETMAAGIKQQQEEMKKSEKLRTIGELSARLNHDLRNPLHLIKNTLALIKADFKNTMTDDTKSDFDRIDKAVNRMSHQIESVLDFVGARRLNIQENSIRDIINSAISKMPAHRSCEIHVSENDATINCDYTKMEIVFENLLLNAVQSMTGEGEVNIRISDKDDCVVIDVQDSGQGIPPHIMDKIFEPLFTTKQTGTGLGLVTCKSIVEQHGGTISARTNPTVFTITMPKLKVSVSEPATMRG